MRNYSASVLLLGLVASELVYGYKAKTPVTDKVYQDLVEYAGYPKISSGQCNQTASGASLIQLFDITSTDTQAGLWKFPSKQQIILALPGSASIRDFLTDFDLALVDYDSPGAECPEGCKVAHGFLGAWNSLAAEMMPALEDALAANPGYATVISGHSLGAALAQLAFGSLANGDYNVVAAYTYGQPRIGNQVFADYIDSLAGASDIKNGILYRVTHYNDGIPQLPPQLLGYRHPRGEYWESTNVTSEATTYQCYGQEPPDCNDSAGGIGVNDAHGTYAGFVVDCS